VLRAAAKSGRCSPLLRAELFSAPLHRHGAKRSVKFANSTYSARAIVNYNRIFASAAIVAFLNTDSGYFVLFWRIASDRGLLEAKEKVWLIPRIGSKT
jgi:hypothetical protein